MYSEMQTLTYRLKKINKELWGGGQNIEKLEEKFTFYSTRMYGTGYFQRKCVSD